MAIKDNKELEIVPPHPTNFLRSLIKSLVRQLKDDDEADMTVPTLLSRAKSLVNRESYIVLVTTKGEGDDN